MPAARAAIVNVEERAAVQAIDGQVPMTRDGTLLREFKLSPECHELLVRYEEEYVRLGGGVGILTWSPFTVAATAAASAASVAENTSVSRYETDEPIRFHVPAKPGMKYWITSTFTGDVFMPRVAVLNAADERVDVILPNEPCAAKADDTPPGRASP